MARKRRARHLHIGARRREPEDVKWRGGMAGMKLASPVARRCCTTYVSVAGDCLGLLEPGIPLVGPGTEQRSKRQGLQRLDATELQRGLAHLVQARHAIDPLVVPRWRIHRDQQVSRSSFQEFVGKGLAFAVLEGKTGQEYPVEEAFHQGRNAAPPDR